MLTLRGSSTQQLLQRLFLSESMISFETVTGSARGARRILRGELLGSDSLGGSRS